MLPLLHQLDKLLLVIRQTGFPIDRYLRPGLSATDIDVRTQHLPVKLPPELYTLYQWHNGTTDEKYIPLFRDEEFLSLDDALQEYDIIQEYYAPYDPYLRLCFPFATLEGSWYVLPASSQPLRPDLERPVINVSEGITVYFLSFSHMLSTIIEWIETGVHRLDDPDTDHDRELAIWRKHNPGLF